MSKVYLEDSTLTDIANAIRAKAGNTTQLLPSEMPAAITSLPSGGGGGGITDKDILCYCPIVLQKTDCKDFSEGDLTYNGTWQNWQDYIKDINDVILLEVYWGSYIFCYTWDQKSSIAVQEDGSIFFNGIRQYHPTSSSFSLMATLESMALYATPRGGMLALYSEDTVRGTPLRCDDKSRMGINLVIRKAAQS